MIGTILIAVVGYSASIFFASLAIISFVETGGRLKSDAEAIRRLLTIGSFLVSSIGFAWLTRFLIGGAI